LLNPDINKLTFEFKLISTFIIRSLLDFIISLGLMYMFYCLGMRRLWILNNPYHGNNKDKNNNKSVIKMMRLLEDNSVSQNGGVGMPADKLFMDRESRRVVSVTISENIE
jgi:hypothetical protein